jgi:uncharacterized coiled-coil protein SlyX
MARAVDYFSGVTLFLAGVVMGILSARKSPATTEGAEVSSANPVEAMPDAESTEDWQRSVSTLESRLAAQEVAAAVRFGQIESRLDSHSAKLAEAPSTSQIVAVMEQLISKTMVSLDDRLTTQAHSIEVLKTTVSQTDSLLERVLESLDSLQNHSESSDAPEDGIFSRAV